MSEVSSEQPRSEPPNRRQPQEFRPREKDTFPVPPHVGPFSDDWKKNRPDLTAIGQKTLPPPQPKTERPGSKKFREPSPGEYGTPRSAGPLGLPVPDDRRPDWNKIKQSKIYHPTLTEKILNRLPFLKGIARKLRLR